jgi:hypothetical protein
MNRTAGMLLVVAALGGCMSSTGGSGWGYSSGSTSIGSNRASLPPTVPGVQGPWGAPVVMATPYSSAPPGESAARQMLAQSVPLDMVQMHPTSGNSSGVVQASYMGEMGSSSMMPPGAGMPAMMPPGMPPGGAISPPGVPFNPAMPAMQIAGTGPPGVVAAAGALTGAVPSRFAASRTSVRFVSPATMKISWYVPGGTGKGSFSANQLEVPGRYNFVQAAIYRLKLNDIPGHANLELYPTLEVVPANLKTTAFLAHSSVPISFTEEDIEQVVAGNFVVKVVYLPDPQFQDLAATGTEEVVSSRLEPGVDPIAEAYRRGSILLVVRLGNIDLEAPNTPAMDAPSPYAPRPAALPGPMPPGMVPGRGMMPGLPNPMMPGMPMPPGMMAPGMMPPGMAQMMPGAVTGPGAIPDAVLNGKPVMMMGPNGPVMVGPASPVNGPTTPNGTSDSGSQQQPGNANGGQSGPQSKAPTDGATSVQLANFPAGPGAFPTTQTQSDAPKRSWFQRVFGKKEVTPSDDGGMSMSGTGGGNAGNSSENGNGK